MRGGQRGSLSRPLVVRGYGRRSLNPLVVLLIGFVLVLIGACRTPPPAAGDVDTPGAATVSVNGARISYLDLNPQAGGTPILYLHGYSGTGFEMTYLVGHLPRDLRVIAPDMPGFGRSGKPEVEYNLAYYLSFVRGFISALNLESVYLVGHSLGGKIAAVYAALDGSTGMEGGLGFVRRLVLVAPYGLDGEAGELIEFLSNTGSLVDISFNLHNQTLIDVAVRLNVFHDDSRIPAELIAYISNATFESENGVRALANVTRNAIARDPINWLLPEIGVPTLVIWGENDRVLSYDNVDVFVSLIPGSSLSSIAECGHMPHVERPAETGNAIESFLGYDD